MPNEEKPLYQVTGGFEVRKVKKKTLLLHQGNKATYFFHVVKGCLKSYVINSEGKECVIHLAPEGWVLGDLESFIYDADAIFNIAAVEDSEVIFFDKRMIARVANADREALLQEIERLHRHIIKTNQRFIQLLSYSAEERYDAFCDMYPTLVQRIPLKLIASYLGITPEFLSRIRKRKG